MVLALAAGSWLGSVGSVASQPATLATPIARVDVHGSVGWANVSADHLASYDEWDHGVAQGIVGAGWYWNDHVKTEVDLRFAGAAEFYRFEQTTVNGRPTYRTSKSKLQSSGIGVGQHYQFLRNAWVHPYVGAGIDFRRESLEELVDPVVLYDDRRGDTQEVVPARRAGPSISWTAKPFVAVGLKAYVSQRGFFRADFRVSVRGGAEEVVTSAGFGVDF